jgi:hypothetical protein
MSTHLKEKILDKQQATHIEAQLKELHASLQSLSGGDSVESMVSMIHKPGWTTIAEVAFFTGIVDSMISHTKALSSLKQVLLSGAAKVALNPQPLPPGKE